MNEELMLLITPQRIEFHPEFSALLFANWGANFDIEKKQERARDYYYFGDDFSAISNSVNADCQASAVEEMAANFWFEYQKSLVTKAAAAQRNKRSDGRSPKPNGEPTPS